MLCAPPGWDHFSWRCRTAELCCNQNVATGNLLFLLGVEWKIIYEWCRKSSIFVGVEWNINENNLWMVYFPASHVWVPDGSMIHLLKWAHICTHRFVPWSGLPTIPFKFHWRKWLAPRFSCNQHLGPIGNWWQETTRVYKKGCAQTILRCFFDTMPLILSLSWRHQVHPF